MSIVRFVGDAWQVRVDEDDPRDGALRIAEAVGLLAGETHADGTVYVGYDTRPSSVELAEEVGGVIAAHGMRVLVSSTHCPTPALCEAVRRDPDAFAAVMLTAGNRPDDYFGLRLRTADGNSAAPADIETLESLIPSRPTLERGAVERVDVVGPYLDAIARFIDADAVRRARPTVVCDSMHGATSGHAARLLRRLGAEVVELHAAPKEDFGGLHPAACEPWIDDCEQGVRDVRADMGVALDGGGDRIALIDGAGTFVTPHKMLSLVMEHLVSGRGMSGRMVVPIFCSSIVKRQAKRLGCPLTVTPAGFVWMREEMGSEDVLCAGDAQGGVCIPSIGLERDALAVAAALVEALAVGGVSVAERASQLDEQVGRMEYGRRDIRMGSGAIQMLRNFLPGLNPADIAGRVPVRVSHSGGLRVEFEDDSWLLVRPSRTEPLVRVYAEAKDIASRDELLVAGVALAKGAE